MIPLDSELWNLYDRKYEDEPDFYLPEMLKLLETARGDGFWSILEDVMYEKLSHQGTVYKQAYVALPHMVRIFQERKDIDENEPWMMLVEISYLAAFYKGSRVHEDVAVMKEFHAGLDSMRQAIRPYILEHYKKWDDEKKRLMALSYIALRNQEEQTAYIFSQGLSGAGQLDEIEIEGCPHCGEYHCINLAECNCMLSDNGRLLFNKKHKIQITPKDLSELQGFWAELAALLEQISETELLGRLPFLFGEVNCVKCGEAFSIWENKIQILQ